MGPERAKSPARPRQQTRRDPSERVTAPEAPPRRSGDDDERYHGSWAKERDRGERPYWRMNSEADRRWRDMRDRSDASDQREAFEDGARQYRDRDRDLESNRDWWRG